MKIYTRGGDTGETTLLGGVRVPKDDPRVAAYGTVDELNAAIGLALALGADGASLEGLERVQEDLFTIGARLAAADPAKARNKGTIPELASDRIGELESWIDRLDVDLPSLDAFILPGGAPAGAQLHVARTVCRRAEREIVGLIPEQPDLKDVVLPYLNRLSDLLFTLARFANLGADRRETAWLPQRRRGEEDGGRS